jgi:hypothetical protein
MSFIVGMRRPRRPPRRCARRWPVCSRGRTSWASRCAQGPGCATPTHAARLRVRRCACIGMACCHRCIGAPACDLHCMDGGMTRSTAGCPACCDLRASRMRRAPGRRVDAAGGAAAVRGGALLPPERVRAGPAAPCARGPQCPWRPRADLPRRRGGARAAAHSPATRAAAEPRAPRRTARIEGMAGFHRVQVLPARAERHGPADDRLGPGGVQGAGGGGPGPVGLCRRRAAQAGGALCELSWRTRPRPTGGGLWHAAVTGGRIVVSSRRKSSACAPERETLQARLHARLGSPTRAYQHIDMRARAGPPSWGDKCSTPRTDAAPPGSHATGSGAPRPTPSPPPLACSPPSGCRPSRPVLQRPPQPMNAAQTLDRSSCRPAWWTAWPAGLRAGGGARVGGGACLGGGACVGRGGAERNDPAHHGKRARGQRRALQAQ